MRFAFTWDPKPRIWTWEWVPKFRYARLPWGSYSWFDKNLDYIAEIELAEKHLYVWWGYAQLHWVWGDQLYA